MGDTKALVQPSVKLYSTTEPIESADEVCPLVRQYRRFLFQLTQSELQILDFALATLHILNSSDFAQIPDCFLQPYNHLPVYTEGTFELPSVLVPPEVIELDSLSTDSGEDALVKKEEWAEYYLRLFDNDVRQSLI